MSTKKCNGCKRNLTQINFTRNNKVYARCNDCSKNMSNKKNSCEVCGIRANYNIPSLSWGRFCKTHKKIGMIDVMNKKCIEPNCPTRPNFNFPNETKRLYCKTHAKPGMVDIKSKKCIEPNCPTRPNFNLPNESIALYCKTHAKPGMVDIKSKRCIEDGCPIIPNFNLPNQSIALYCKAHAKPDMIDIKSKRCIEDGCPTMPNFNLPNQTKPLYCRTHAKPGMVDVKSNKCILDDCTTRSFYGYCCQPTTHCNQHKSEQMFKKPTRFCIGINDNDECKELATHGINEPLHCEKHSTTNEICLLAKKCNHCGRNDEILDKEGLCLNFCSLIKLDTLLKTKYKEKEATMVRYLRSQLNLKNDKDEYEAKEILADKIIDSSCNLYRPDLLYDCGTHIVVIECDENQHKNYNWKSCVNNKSLDHAEEKRMYEIMVAYGIPAIFLRYNPDSFTNGGVVNKKYNMNKRLELLKKWVEYCIKLEPKGETDQLRYKKIFYDEYKEENIEFKTIIEKDII